MSEAEQKAEDTHARPNDAGNAVESGDLLPLIYRELRALAEGTLRGERRDHTLQATALVHEVYLKLAAHPTLKKSDRTEFFGLAALAMRHVLVDHARSRNRQKRGGKRSRVALTEMITIAEGSDFDVIDLDEALTAFAEHDARKAKVVELRFFAGLSNSEIADVMGIGSRTVERDWQYARAWLFRRLDLGSSGSSE